MSVSDCIYENYRLYTRVQEIYLWFQHIKDTRPGVLLVSDVLVCTYMTLPRYVFVGKLTMLSSIKRTLFGGNEDYLGTFRRT